MEISRPLDVFRKLVKPAKKPVTPPPPPPPTDKWADPFEEMAARNRRVEYEPKTMCAKYKLWKKRKKMEKSLPKFHPKTGEKLSWKVKFGYYGSGFNQETGQTSGMLRVIEIESRPSRMLSRDSVYNYHWGGPPERERFLSSYSGKIEDTGVTWMWG